MGSKQSGRDYTSLWKRILSNHLEKQTTTRVAAPPEKIYTLKRMISKEKDMDQDWKEKRYFKLTSTPIKDGNGDVTGLEFKLVLYREREIVTSTILRK